jgi:LysM repeat protein
MSDKNTPQGVINKFEKRQRMTPYFLIAIAVILVIVGIIIIVSVVSGGRPFAGIFATKTPTATATFTPTATQPTSTPSMTPTITLTPTVAASPTASGPQLYVVQQDDTCYDIAAAFKVDLLVLLAINNFTGGTCPITPGQTIVIPAPGSQLPTPTPIPSDLPRGTEIEYTVQPDDTLALIAAKFNSTVTSIMNLNKLTSETIYMGQVLKVQVNLVTPTRTFAPTSTLAYPIVTKPPTTTPNPTKQ